MKKNAVKDLNLHILKEDMLNPSLTVLKDFIIFDKQEIPDERNGLYK